MSSPRTAADVAAVAGQPRLELGQFDLAALGYRCEEFFLGGTAQSFRLDRPMSADGRWDARPDERADYRTRAVVVRPVDAASFSGTVVLEWLNVSGGVDVGTDWIYTHRELMRSGAAWVGVSAQRAGIEGGGLRESKHLKKADPDRYGELTHPGDAYSYDIFTQAAAAVRSGSLLGPLGAAIVLGIGESQSAAFLVTYINAIDPIAQGIDGFLVHGRGSRAAWLDGEFFSLRRMARDSVGRFNWLAGHQVRRDARVPVLTVQSETDFLLQGGRFGRQPDSHHHQTWEIAGAAHFDTYGLRAGFADDGSLTGAQLARLLRPIENPRGFTTSAPANSAPQHHYVLQAAVHHLRTRVVDGTAIPAAERLRTRPVQPLSIWRDGYGIAHGGLRTPWVDVPVATLSGLGQRVRGFGFLFGSTRPFTPEQLAHRYPGGRAEYLEQFSAALEGAVGRGHLLAADRAEAASLGPVGWPE